MAFCSGGCSIVEYVVLEIPLQGTKLNCWAFGRCEPLSTAETRQCFTVATVFKSTKNAAF